jgi:transposase
LFWFSDEQWLRIEPDLPVNQPDPECKDDRRILSGIMCVIKVGCPPEFGPHMTFYNRFARWSENQALAECLAHSIVMTGLTDSSEYSCKLRTQG